MHQVPHTHHLRTLGNNPQITRTGRQKCRNHQIEQRKTTTATPGWGLTLNSFLLPHASSRPSLPISSPNCWIGGGLRKASCCCPSFSSPCHVTIPSAPPHPRHRAPPSPPAQNGGQRGARERPCRLRLLLLLLLYRVGRRE